MLKILLVCVSISLVSVTGVTLLKYSIQMITQNSMPNIYLLATQLFVYPLFWVGIFCYGISFLAMIYALSFISLTYFYPTSLGLSIFFIVIIGNIFFGEHISFLNIIGFASIAVGIFLSLF